MYQALCMGTGHLACFIPLQGHSSSMRQTLYLVLQLRKQAQACFIYLLKVTQLVSGRDKTEIWAVWLCELHS